MVAKRPFISTFLFLFLTLLIHESSGFMLSHTHSESRKRHLSNNLFAPNENVIFKNYAQTFMKSDQEQFIFSQAASNTTTEEYVDVPVDSPPEELTDEEEKQKAMQDYEDDILNCTLSENNDGTSNNTLSENEESKEKMVKENKEESSDKEEKTENENKSQKSDENSDWNIEYKNSTENQSNETNETESEVEENEVDYSFNISEYAHESLDEWDYRENNSNQTTYESSVENQEEENQFLRTYDESYLNETDFETNETANGNATLSEEEREEEGEKFLKKEELDKMGKYLPGDDFLLNYTSIDNQNKSTTEYNTIKNDTQLEKDLKSILNFEHDKDIIS